MMHKLYIYVQHIYSKELRDKKLHAYEKLNIVYESKIAETF